jgi:hypothetical protein
LYLFPVGQRARSIAAGKYGHVGRSTVAVDMTRAAFQEAASAGHGWVGPQHFFLALLNEPSVARDVLESFDLQPIVDSLHRGMRDPDLPATKYDPKRGLSGPNPAGNKLVGRAHGLALAAGVSTPTAEHWLIAMMYGDESLLSLLVAKGMSQQAVLDRLRDRGVWVPDVAPKIFRPYRGHHKIYIAADDLDPVLAILSERHPPGSEWRWGFNWVGEPRCARVSGESGVDLTGIAAEVGAALLERPTPPDPD